MLKILKWLTSGVILSRLSLGYLDPGSGSFILQILLAGFLGLMLSAKLFWHRFISFFKRSPSTDPETEEPSEQ